MSIHVVQGQGGPAVANGGSGEELPLRLSKKRGGVVGQQLHGRHYEAASRGRVFSAVQSVTNVLSQVGGTQPLCVLFNPAGQLQIDDGAILLPSLNGRPVLQPGGRLVSIIRWQCFFDANAAGSGRETAVLTYLESTRFSIGGQTVQETNQPALIGTNIDGVAQFWSNPVLQSNSVTETVFYPMAMISIISGPYVPSFAANLDGVCIMPPNTAVAIRRLAPTSNSQQFRCQVTWEEIDL